MKKFLLQLCWLLPLIVTYSCSPPLKVNSDYDKNVDFAKYKTFALFKSDSSQTISQLNQSRIADAIRGEMVKKGFQEATSNPDVLINSVAIFKDRTSVSATNYGYGGVYRPYYWGGGVGYTNYDVQHYKDGSLIIDIIDANTQKLIWQGIGNKEIDGPIKDPDTKIPKAISMIMEGFPPKAKKS
ncbi:DUF4136 domain-containing protein [Flavisolibacter tropicus]|uniref:DUF4136 domain-containing protein n=1 Tax=Flavisolibacter tropicus TaxID=1492898 RepID=A0A172TQF4_9BACT|nr:DUF4136 domain-containing protein [Flavisolibacter tropicus]ANE49212.1 hypothetical protein SY85_00520 [Flavisolibacter tropicus]